MVTAFTGIYMAGKLVSTSLEKLSNEIKKYDQAAGTSTPQLLGADDTYQFTTKKEEKTHTNPKLKTMLKERTVTIKDGDNGVNALGARLGLNAQDIQDQIRDMKDPKTGKPLVPADYDFTAKHSSDLKWFKEGYTLKLRYPATQAEKDKYEEFVQDRRTAYYNNKASKK